MENPKLRIESNGTVTEIYIDGVKIKNATECLFHAEILNVKCEIEKYKTDENGKIIIENDDTIKESISVFEV